METNEDVLNIVYNKNDSIIYETDENGIVTILEIQNHKIQRFFRKIGFKIPEYRKTELDEYSSYVFLLIDGVNSIEKIGELLENHFGEKIQPLYERLLLFLNHIDTNCGYIYKLEN
ncbi:PqqD family peptide modification chaperone [Miniphocaeibacter massiliensis]|uniref:PqqD family peptide modification chaperone n=1 Tax=Miniphocaeibacter massiliensis TaxID=2041841 RepID=UPI000C1BB00F|nr:PqqD family peptide modification chaperone [Miniphocaeibacter massiliensis]